MNERNGESGTQRATERAASIGTSAGTSTGVIDTIAHSLEENTSRRVFGEPLTVGPVTVIPAARLLGRGGGGGGGRAGRRGLRSGDGSQAGGQTGEGGGGGLSQSARPVGAFVVNGAEVSWRPALDLNRIILGSQILAVVALVVARSVLNHRRRVRWGRGPLTRAQFRAGPLTRAQLRVARRIGSR